MGRQHQGVDRPGVRQVPEGNGKQGKMEKTSCKIICGAPTTLAVKGLITMMMMTMSHDVLPAGLCVCVWSDFCTEVVPTISCKQTDLTGEP